MAEASWIWGIVTHCSRQAGPVVKAHWSQIFHFLFFEKFEFSGSKTFELFQADFEFLTDFLNYCPVCSWTQVSVDFLASCTLPFSSSSMHGYACVLKNTSIFQLLLLLLFSIDSKYFRALSTASFYHLLSDHQQDTLCWLAVHYFFAACMLF